MKKKQMKKLTAVVKTGFSNEHGVNKDVLHQVEIRRQAQILALVEIVNQGKISSKTSVKSYRNK